MWDYLYAFTPRSVVIKNRRLGLFWRVMQLVTILYLAWTLTADLDWAMQVETPEGFHDQWIDTTSENYFTELGLDDARTHCLHPEKLWYKWSDDYVYHPKGCIALNEGDIWQKKGESSTFIPTYFEDTWVEQASGTKECAGLEKCCADGTCFGNRKVGVFKSKTHISTVKGTATCRCEAEASYFVKGVAGLPMYLSSSYVVASPGKERLSGSTNRAQDNLIVFVRNHAGDFQPESKTSEKESKVPVSATDESKGSVSATRAPPADHDSSLLVESSGTLHTYDSKQSQKRTVASEIVQRLSGRGRRTSKSMDGAKPLKRSQHEHDSLSLPAEEISIMRAETGRTQQRNVESLREASARPHQKQEGKSTITNNPFLATRFEPGSAVGMSLERWLEHAEVTDGDLAGQPFYENKVGGKSLLDVSNTEVRSNTGPDSERNHPPFRMTGLELTLDVSFENKAYHGISGVDGVVMKVKVMARGGWHSRPATHVLIPLDPESGRTKYLHRYYYGVSCKIKSTGKFGTWSVFAITAAMSSVIAFWQVPGAIITVIALYLLGSASLVYYGAAMDTVHVDEQLTGMSLRALATYYTFQNRIKTGESADGKDGLSRDKLEKDLRAALGGEDCVVDEEQLNKSVNLIFDMFDPDGENVIPASKMTDIAMQDEFVKFGEAVDKFSDRQDTRLEAVFKKIFIGKDDSLEDVSSLIPVSKRASLARRRATRLQRSAPSPPPSPPKISPAPSQAGDAVPDADAPQQ